jgi:hypothetical protein
VRITNTTKWRTADLRKLFKAALKAESLIEHEAGKYIDVAPGRTRVRGRATLTGWWVRMTVRNPAEGEECMPAELLDKFARVFVHEIGHNAGLTHDEMVDWWTIPVPWTVGLEVRPKPVKPKVKRDVQAERHAHAIKKLAEWEKKEARAARILKQWQRKVRYYEQARARKAASQRQPEESK